MQSVTLTINKTATSHSQDIAWQLILPDNLSRWQLNPSKRVYDPDQPDGRLSLTASGFNQLGQYMSSRGRRGYCYADVTIFFPSDGFNHQQ